MYEWVELTYEERREGEGNKLNLWLGVSERGRRNGDFELWSDDGLMDKGDFPSETESGSASEKESYGQSLGLRLRRNRVLQRTQHAPISSLHHSNEC